MLLWPLVLPDGSHPKVQILICCLPGQLPRPLHLWVLNNEWRWGSSCWKSLAGHCCGFPQHRSLLGAVCLSNTYVCSDLKWCLPSAWAGSGQEGVQSGGGSISANSSITPYLAKKGDGDPKEGAPTLPTTLCL